jgi:hypothetical protein
MQGTYTPDIWVSSHAGQFNLHKIYKPGDAYDPARFGDLSAYKAKIAGYQAAYEKATRRGARSSEVGSLRAAYAGLVCTVRVTRSSGSLQIGLTLPELRAFMRPGSCRIYGIKGVCS